MLHDCDLNMASPSSEEALNLCLSPQRSSLTPRAVKFLPDPQIIPIESSSNISGHTKMEKQVYEIFSGDQVTDCMLGEAAKLFNENYGIWGERSHNPGKHDTTSLLFCLSDVLLGKPVKLSARRLREQYLPDPATISCYVRVTVDGNLAGNAFACRWKHDGKNICWITQLVVDRNYRERGLASGLLRSIRFDTDDMYGIMSSHPAACMAAASSFGSKPCLPNNRRYLILTLHSGH